MLCAKVLVFAQHCAVDFTFLLKVPIAKTSIDTSKIRANSSLMHLLSLLIVHYMLAQQIAISLLPEQSYPVLAMGGWRWRKNLHILEHNCGNVLYCTSIMPMHKNTRHQICSGPHGHQACSVIQLIPYLCPLVFRNSSFSYS